jgi:hypothetical protein
VLLLLLASLHLPCIPSPLPHPESEVGVILLPVAHLGPGSRAGGPVLWEEISQVAAVMAGQ